MWRSMMAWVGVFLIQVTAVAHAMDFASGHPSNQPKSVFIEANGRINPGDDRKLHEFVGALPSDIRLLGIFLDSPGGNLVEGVRLAETIHNSGISTAVINVCASACFIAFSAGTPKIVFSGARIGVHSATEDRGETLTSQAVTTMMARAAHEYGVPNAIIGKMVTTPPDQIAWLTMEDLLSIPGVKIAPNEMASGQQEYQPGAALRPGSAASSSMLLSRPAGTIAPTPPGSNGSPAQDWNVVGTLAPQSEQPQFQAGRQARADWEQWFGSQTGDGHDGAEWWAAHRSTASRDHLSCEAQFGVSGLWLRGCQQAQQLLAWSDHQRRSDSVYKAGWNSL